MGIRANILAGIAASALFYLIQKYFLGWPYPWDIVSTVVVLLATVTLAALLAKKAPERWKTGTSILSDIRARKSMSARLEDFQSTGAPDRILSDLEIGDDANFEIKRTKI